MEKLTKKDVEKNIKRVAEYLATMILDWRLLDDDGLPQEFTADRKFSNTDTTFDLHAFANEDEIHVRVTRSNKEIIEDCVCGQCNE